MKIAVIGTGYVGLVSGTCLAHFGHDVVCVDSNRSKVEALLDGVIPIYEPGLDDLVVACTRAGRLDFTTELEAAVADARAIFIAVGTPPRPGDGQADLTFVHDAARQIARCVRDDAVIITKSTVPVGTGDTIERIVADVRPGSSIAVVSNPEFLREGSAITDFLRPDRVVIGTSDERARAVMEELYAALQGICPIVTTGRRTAELIKYTANAFLATKITFMNEIANLCEKVGADIGEIALGVGLDHRIGKPFLQAGPGYGGSCFPKDTVALLRTAQDHGVHLRLVENTIAVNDARKREMAAKIAEALGGSVAGRTIAILGLTFKPNTDDMREAPSVAIIEALQRKGALVRAHDPVGMPAAAQMLRDVTFSNDAYVCAAGADAVVLVTEWDELRALDLGRLASVARGRTFVDLRNVYDAASVIRAGFSYTGIGALTAGRPGVQSILAPAKAKRKETAVRKARIGRSRRLPANGTQVAAAAN